MPEGLAGLAVQPLDVGTGRMCTLTWTEDVLHWAMARSYPARAAAVGLALLAGL